MLNFLSRFGRFIRFSHTLFALPFALAAMVVAADGWPAGRTTGLILLCMVCARTLAMLFNRIVDYELDQENPRTVERSRLINKTTAKVGFVFFTAGFCAGAVLLNTLCAALSPVALVLITFYSMTKRFTLWCHFFLGLALSAAPAGAWAAVTGELMSLPPYLLSFGVLCWVFGFDLIYATLDVDFDREKGLHSIPARLGVDRAKRLAVILHLMALGAFLGFGWVAGLGGVYFTLWALCLPVLVWEHLLARSPDPGRVNQAFFHANALVSFLLFFGVALDYAF